MTKTIIRKCADFSSDLPITTAFAGDTSLVSQLISVQHQLHAKPRHVRPTSSGITLHYMNYDMCNTCDMCEICDIGDVCYFFFYML